MLEAKLSQASTLKQVLDAIKELVTDVNFEIDEDGLKLQAMDNSHVALVALLLETKGFETFRCDRNMALGVNVASLQKVVKCADNNDIVTIRAQDDADVLSMVFETKNTDRVGEYEIKLMDILTEHLGIPDTTYDAEVSLGAGEFTRIIRDLKELGESVRIEATKEGVKFGVEGDVGTATITLKETANGRSLPMDEDRPEQSEEEEEEGADRDGDEQQDDEEGGKADTPGGGRGDEDGDEDEKPVVKKRKLDKSKSKKAKANGKAKSGALKQVSKRIRKGDEDDDGDRRVSINLQQSVSLTFSIKYLSNFTKAAPLAKYVTLHMSYEIPLLVEYAFGNGYVRYYLAPKISDE